MPVDPRAATGFTDSAAAYERARPSYPREAIQMLAAAFGLTSESAVLDLAAGTGKLTRLLRAVAGHVIAVEPSEQMLGQLRSSVPGVEALSGTAESIPVGDGAVHAVFVAQAFHWFDARAAVREIARVLRPGGGVALLWNQSAGPAAEDPRVAAIENLLARYKQEAGPYPAPDAEWQAAFAGAGLFAPIERGEYHLAQRLDSDGLAALVASRSWIANLPAAERQRVLARVREIAGAETVTIDYTTEVYWTRLRQT